MLTEKLIGIRFNAILPHRVSERARSKAELLFEREIRIIFKFHKPFLQRCHINTLPFLNDLKNTVILLSGAVFYLCVFKSAVIFKFKLCIALKPVFFFIAELFRSVCAVTGRLDVA